MSPAHKTRQRTHIYPGSCYCCCAPIPPQKKYCPPCRRLTNQGERQAIADALKAAWDPAAKGFRCYYTGIILELFDLTSPWYITFDHRIPGKKGDLVACAAWVNVMKSQLSENEFKAVIKELARSRAAGEPFNMAVAKFEYWIGFARPKPLKPDLLTNLRLPKFGNCFICSSTTYPFSPYCPPCRRFIIEGNFHKEHVAGMKAVWDKERKAFYCSMIGVKLDIHDNTSPVFMSFDHRIPGEKDTIWVVAIFINIMKNALSEDEFWLVVKELARHFQTQEAFNKDIIKFAYWKGWYRAKMRAMRARRLAAKARRK